MSMPRSSEQSELNQAEQVVPASVALSLNRGLRRDTRGCLLLCYLVPILPAEVRGGRGESREEGKGDIKMRRRKWEKRKKGGEGQEGV